MRAPRRSAIWGCSAKQLALLDLLGLDKRLFHTSGEDDGGGRDDNDRSYMEHNTCFNKVRSAMDAKKALHLWQLPKPVPSDLPLEET